LSVIPATAIDVSEGQIAIARQLRVEGATKVTFHANGAVASIEFGPAVTPHEETQHEEPVDPRDTHPRRPTGGLVPRDLDRS
jgi:hypothetical protein